MSLLYFNGFDFLTTTHLMNQAFSYNQYGYSSSGTRYGYGGLAYNTGLAASTMHVAYQFTDTGSNYLIFGVAFKYTISSSLYNWGVAFYNSEGAQCYIRPLDTHVFELWRGLATSKIDESDEDVWTDGQWYYLEGKLSCTNSSDYDIRLDGETIMSGSSTDLQQQSSAGASRVYLYGGYGQAYNARYDDLYVCDDQGSRNNDFLGEVIVRTLLPTGAGTYTQWTPSAGSNYENVDETTPDDDTTYNATGVLDNQDSFAVGNLPDSQVAVHGVKTRVITRKEGAGYRALKNFVVVNSSKYNETKNTLHLDYDVYDGSVLEYNPDDSQDWEVADIDAMEVGYQLAAVQSTTTTTTTTTTV